MLDVPDLDRVFMQEVEDGVDLKHAFKTMLPVSRPMSRATPARLRSRTAVALLKIVARSPRAILAYEGCDVFAGAHAQSGFALPARSRVSPVAGLMTSIVPPAQWLAISIIGFSLPIPRKQTVRQTCFFPRLSRAAAMLSARGATL